MDIPRLRRRRRTLGNICRSKGETEKVVHHFEVPLGTTSSFNWNDEIFWIHSSLAVPSPDEGKFDDGHARIERAISYTVNNAHDLGKAIVLQAVLWHKQHRSEEARFEFEVLRVVDIFEKLGATQDVENCRTLLQRIQRESNSPVASGQLREFLRWCDFLHVLTSHSRLKEPNESIHGHIEFFEWVLLLLWTKLRIWNRNPTAVLFENQPTP